ncbi:hypothetical protein TNCV_93311 [Trichonephila clavipes]|nr:hypothetical protein TNCV_93311 [Trichonephila clavipes]
MNKLRKTLAVLDCTTVSSEEFFALDDDNVCTAPIMAERHFGVKKYKCGKQQKRNEMFEKASALLHCSTVLPGEFVAVGVMIMCVQPELWQTDILEFVKSSKSIIETDSDDENEMNNATPSPTSSEMKNIRKNKRNYLDAHSEGKMNNKMDDME